MSLNSTPLVLGGQAVIEGVMVRSPRFVSVAIRASQGHCIVETRPLPSVLLARRWLRAPFVRGVAVLAEGLWIGTWALTTSARAATSDQVPLSAGRIRLILVRSLTISIALFFLLPTVLARLVAGGGMPPLGQNALEGAIRIALVLAFLALIGRVPAIRRVFQYHGAEHKAIHAYEAGLPLDLTSAAATARFHARCGTTFLLMVLLVAIAVFALLGHPRLAVRLAERVSLLPVVAAISYELMRLADRVRPFRILIVPGLWLQRLTTREPDAGQLSIALSALKDVLAKETEAATAQSAAQ